jgi:hypothetical protein
MLSFHKSHSRRDLLEIVKLFKLPIEDAEDYNKKDLTEKMIDTLNRIDNIIPDEHFYGINNLNELKEHLIKPNQKKILSIKDKNEIMTTAKLIISFCKGGYCVQISYFDTMDDIYVEARRVSQFGDIPSVRRMCKLLNDNPHSNERIYPVISKKVQRELEIKKLTSKKVHTSLHVKHGTVNVVFD